MLLLLLLLLLVCVERGDAAITAAGITLTSYEAGVTGTASVDFTTATTVPIGGTIVVTFPSTFYVAATTLFTITSGLDASCTMVANPAAAQATITVNGVDAAPGQIVFTLDGISNPGSGTTSTYSIRTKSAGGSTLESTTVPGSTITVGTISAPVLTAASLVAGRTTSYTVTFTTTITLRVGSVIALQFPILSASTIVFTGATLSSLVGIDAASTVVQVASPYIRITTAGQDIAAGTSVSITYGNIINPAARTTGFFGVHTRHPTGAIFQENQAVAGLTYTSTTLPSAVVTPASNWAGISTDYTLVFANSAYLPPGTRVDITFPARFDISAVTFTRATNVPTVNTVFSSLSTTKARMVTGNIAVVPGTGRGFTLEGITNPGTSCDEYIVEYCTATWETYTVSITDGGGNLFEELTSITGTPIVKKPLTYGRVRPLLKSPDTLTVATVTVDTVATIPLGGYIEAVLPDGYSVGAATLVAGSLVGIPSASSALTATANSVSLMIAGSSILPNTGLSFTVTQITTPPNSAVGYFVVRTRDAGGNTIEESTMIGGEGCTYVNDCSGHGTCTLLSKVCICNTGWGAPTDVADYKSPDCSTRVCPSNYAWNTIPSGTSTAHNDLVECSGMGICDRSAGTCTCFPGFEGAACERMSCPNECSDRGVCMSMRDMAAAKNALPISAATTYGGQPFSATWDADRIFGCVCDSGWAVGTASGELQATEYFAADCSKRHCPIGNDPETTVDETNCQGKPVPGGTAVGAAGNKCLVECSNRGVCNYKSGVCTCFQGYTGYACQMRDGLAK